MGYVQHVVNDGVGASLVFATNVAVGNVLAVFTVIPADDAAPTVTDNLGNEYTLVEKFIFVYGGFPWDKAAACFYTAPVTVGGACTVTPGSSFTIGFEIADDTTLDVYEHSSGSGTGTSTAELTLGQAAETVIAVAITNDNDTFTLTAETFTEASYSPVFGRVGGAYKAASDVGPHTCTWTHANRAWGTFIAGFKNTTPSFRIHNRGIVKRGLRVS